MDSNNFEMFLSAKMSREEMSKVFGAEGGYPQCKGIACPSSECTSHEFLGFCIPPGGSYANGKQQRWTDECTSWLFAGSGFCYEIVVVA
ncbi:MAG: hypothetical protein ABMA02_15310 [Saprospiraceae bacterium]